MDAIHILALVSGILLYMTGHSLVEANSDSKRSLGCVFCYVAGILVWCAV